MEILYRADFKSDSQDLHVKRLVVKSEGFCEKFIIKNFKVGYFNMGENLFMKEMVVKRETGTLNLHSLNGRTPDEFSEKQRERLGMKTKENN